MQAQERKGVCGMRDEKIIENAKVNENRREDKRFFKKFIIVLVLATVGGGIVGAASQVVAEGVAGAADSLLSAFLLVAPFGNLILTLLLLVWYIAVFGGLRKRFLAWDGEDEETIESIEGKLSAGMILTSIASILSYFFMGAGFYAIAHFEMDPYQVMSLVRLAAVFGGLICVMVLMTVMQKNIVNLIKEINPEKQGSVYDTGFRKKWSASCDEMERMQTYEAGFYAYQVGAYTCIVLFMVCFVGMLTWDWGLLPLAMVLLVWLVQTVAYGMKCRKLSGHGKKHKKSYRA